MREYLVFKAAFKKRLEALVVEITCLERAFTALAKVPVEDPEDADIRLEFFQKIQGLKGMYSSLCRFGDCVDLYLRQTGYSAFDQAIVYAATQVYGPKKQDAPNEVREGTIYVK